jgi:hypothetical protein
MNGNKVHIRKEIFDKFVDVAQGDRVLAVDIINQILAGYINWQEMMIEVKHEKDLGFREMNN